MLTLISWTIKISKYKNTFAQKVAHQIGRKKFLLLKELKIYLQWTYVKEDLKDS